MKFVLRESDFLIISTKQTQKRYNLQGKDTMIKNKAKIAEIDIAIKELEAEGKIAWTGEWRKNRNGKLEKVYVAVEFIKKN